MKKKTESKKLVLNKRTVVSYDNVQNYSTEKFLGTIPTLPPTVTGMLTYVGQQNIAKN